MHSQVINLKFLVLLICHIIVLSMFVLYCTMNFSKIFLHLYLYFQIIICVTNILIFFAILGFIFWAFILGWSSIDSFLKLLLVLVIYSSIFGIYIFYLLVAYKATISTVKFIKEESVTKFQKFCAYIFPIIAIPTYLLIIFISKIRESGSFFLEFFIQTMQSIFGLL